jgi:hypothetical protein
MVVRAPALSSSSPSPSLGHFEALTRIALPSRREEDAIERVHARAAGHGFELRQIAWIVAALVVIAGATRKMTIAATMRIRTSIRAPWAPPPSPRSGGRATLPEGVEDDREHAQHHDRSVRADPEKSPKTRAGRRRSPREPT